MISDGKEILKLINCRIAELKTERSGLGEFNIYDTKNWKELAK